MTVTLTLPEPPSLNAMIDLAKQRDRFRRPTVYNARKDAYELHCLTITREAGIAPPLVPWPRWRLVSAHFQLHNTRDPIELLAGLKWPVDFLVNRGFVENDSSRELLSIPYPTQEIHRKDRCVILTIESA